MTEQIVQFPGVFASRHCLSHMPGIGKLSSHEIGLRQIVSVVVRGGIDTLRAFKKWIKKKEKQVEDAKLGF